MKKMVIVSSGPSEISDWSIWTDRRLGRLDQPGLHVLEREGELSCP